MMKNKMSKDNFSLMVILLIPVAIAINIVGGQLTSVLKIPVDLDTIGVILVGLLAGPIPAAVTGVLTNLINGIFDPTLIPYAICAFFIGIAAGLLAKYNMTNKVWKLVISGIVIAIVATLTATPVTVFFFGGSTGGGASMLAAGLMATGQRILQSVFSVYIVTEFIGKMLSIFVAYLIIRAIPARSLVKYRFGDKYITKTASSGK
ncbi:ECF transporter S component [Bifidobacterium breve]|uniref:ECF transporter S component n=1 Tax=Bifidobacterium breve TaxID=1685 RepID=UPI0026493EF6|nr:ECF transporter S component [Bifidobacterium breve]MDO8169397.1 ECF transporter S component [Bifidobacterium breve]